MKKRKFLDLVIQTVNKPELDKGERNPYTSGEEIGNPFITEKQIAIKEEDHLEVINLLERKGYDVSKYFDK